MMILQQKKVKLVKYETSRSNLGSSVGIFLDADKVAQIILVGENRR